MSECFPFSGPELARFNAKCDVLVLVGFTIVLVMIAITRPNSDPLIAALIVTCLAAMIGIALILAFASAVRRSVDRLNPSVSVAEGMLSLRIHEQAGGARLDESEWWVGSLRETNLFGHKIFLPRCDAIIIAARFGPPLHRKKYKLAVGLNEELREVWISFLKLADIPHRQRRRKNTQSRIEFDRVTKLKGSAGKTDTEKNQRPS